MTHDEARALIAEGQRALTAEENEGPTVWHVDHGSRRMSLRDKDGDASGEFDDVWFEDHRSAALASWMRSNLATLLDGYAEALEEIERLRAEKRSSLAEVRSAHGITPVGAEQRRDTVAANIQELTKP